MKYSASITMSYSSDYLYDTPMEAFTDMQEMFLNGEIQITVDNTSHISIKTEEHKQ